MGEFLKSYEMKIHALSPIHIGNGGKIGKKEYIYLPWKRKVIVPDIEKMYRAFYRTGKAQAYQDYMLKNSSEDLGIWLKGQGYREQDYLGWKWYELDAGDAFLDSPGQRGGRVKEILCFLKDPYGLPYIPGSSVKGMIRTALLSWEIVNHGEKYGQIKRQIEEGAEREGVKRDQVLRQETRKLETETFHTLSKNERRPGDAVNCNLSGLIVSDSRPVPVERLTLCQKIDYSLDGKEKPLPILREALRPGTEVSFQISIDETRCPYDMEDILEALELFQKLCQQHFYSRFKRGSQEKGIVWLGGGVGFPSKTALYSLFGRDAYRVADKVFWNTLGKNYVVHKHTKDKALKIAPHVCKCTRYQGELYDMGMGRIEVGKA